ncbi:MAG: BlaI/MecI/CopY family transcriptional regulator, partial [Candidatus Sumerlaeota bacterium]|nr:BlaI/MecI/CopY family transcriptional regulator [Candidatus Sumerlaeota bacterium]
TQVGNSYLYSACVGRDRVVRQEVRRFSRRVLEGALQPFLVHFFDGRAPTPEEAALLHDLIRNAEKRPPKPR